MSERNLPRPQAVVLDIGNVLLEWNPERFYDDLVGETRRREMFETTGIVAMNAEADLGDNLAALVADLAEKFPEFGDEIHMWHDRWLEFATPPIWGSVNLLRALRRKGVAVFALSNFGTPTMAIADREYPYLTEFDRRYISGHLGMVKPDPEIYQFVEQDCGVPAELLLFTDDSPDNIAAARVRGWQTHLFTGPEGLAERLVTAGLLREEDI